MKDVVGNKLELGDLVVGMVTDGYGSASKKLQVFIIERFTPQKVGLRRVKLPLFDSFGNKASQTDLLASLEDDESALVYSFYIVKLNDVQYNYTNE